MKIRKPKSFLKRARVGRPKKFIKKVREKKLIKRTPKPLIK